MPDFTFVMMEMCKSINGPKSMSINGYEQHGLFSERHYPTCSCPAYKFGKRVVDFGGWMFPNPCKHIRKAESRVCGWHEQYGEAQEKSGICPRCGGPTVTVKVAV